MSDCKITRRKFMKASATTAAVSTVGAVAVDSAEAMELAEGGRDCSPDTKIERKIIPSACWQCVTRCPIVGYVENGRVVKIEGNPLQPSSRGKICARGQAGINQR